jgi:hypothetical protein
MGLSTKRLRALLTYNPRTGVFRWRVSRGRVSVGAIANSRKSNGMIQIGIDGKRYAAHRLAWLYVHGRWPSNGLDHRNLDNSANRLKNLRQAAQSQNTANCRKKRSNSSGYKGVSLSKDKRRRTAPRWQAQIKVRGRTIHLGRFTSKIVAAKAYRGAARKHFGEFARLQ